MRDINDVIDETTLKTGQPRHVCEKIVRSMFQDVQRFTSKKKGVNIQIPHVGTFYFRSHAIPNYSLKQKSTLAYWIAKLFIGEDKRLTKTVIAATDNIHKCLYNLKQVSLIKEEFIEKHAKYKPKSKLHLENDPDTDLARVEEYITNVKNEFGLDKIDPASETDM